MGSDTLNDRVTSASGYDKWNVVALGARDYYETAVGLHKANMLEWLYTDFYMPDRLQRCSKRRFNAALTSAKTRSLWSIGALAVVLARLPLPKRVHHAFQLGLDNAFGFLCAAIIHISGSRKSIVYSYYLEGFVGFHRLTRTRPAALICFQVHPSPEFVQAVLARDARAFAAVQPMSFVQDQEANYNARAVDRYRRALTFADHIICASHITRESLGSDVHAPVSIVPYGSRFDRRPIAQQTGAVVDKIRLISVCQVVQRKGLHWAFYAMKQLPDDVQQQFEWHVVGRTVDEGIREVAPTNVRYSAFLSEDALSDAMSESDLFIMPSLVEGFGLVYIEALSMGTPILYTRATGAADFCESGRHGFLVPASDWRSIRDVLVLCARDPERLLSMRASCISLSRTVTWERFHRGVVAAAQGTGA